MRPFLKNERDTIRHIGEETELLHLKQERGTIVTRLRSVEEQADQSVQANRMSTLGNRLTALVSTTNRSLPYIKVIMENIQHSLDVIKDGVLRLTRRTYRREHQKEHTVGFRKS